MVLFLSDKQLMTKIYVTDAFLTGNAIFFLFRLAK